MGPHRRQPILAISAIAFVLAAFTPAAPVAAQEALSIEQAMARARVATPAAQALAAAVHEADARVDEARAGYFPRIDVTHAIQRGDQPVFVFGALLAQRRFAESDFAIATLNRPAATTSVRTALTIEQSVFDGGRTRLARRGGSLGRAIAAADEDRGGQDLAFAAAQAFVRVLQAEAAVDAANAAVTAADSDLDRARARRDAGLVTDADVLAIEVRRADIRQRQIAATGELSVARVALNQAVGLPLDQAVRLVPPSLPSTDASAVATVTSEALTERPERRQADLQVQLAGNDRRLARAAWLPTVDVQGAWEFNGRQWVGDQGAWLVGAQLRWNLFNGFADRARLNAAEQAERRARADRDRIAAQIDLEVRTAAVRLATARSRATAALAAAAQAQESQRIVRERYDTGLAGITDVLRAAEAVDAARAHATAAEMDVVLAVIAERRARGRI